jgi:hypothetical protein
MKLWSTPDSLGHLAGRPLGHLAPHKRQRQRPGCRLPDDSRASIEFAVSAAAALALVASVPAGESTGPEWRDRLGCSGWLASATGVVYRRGYGDFG